MAQAESHDTTNPSRRRFLMTAPAAAFAIHKVRSLLPDAALFALEPRINEAEAAYEAALHVWSPADEAMIEWRRSNPEPNDLRGVGYAVMQDWMRREAEARKSCRYDELRAVANAAGRRAYEVLRELVALRAESLEGLKFKARFVDLVDDMDTSIIDDLLAMGGA